MLPGSGIWELNMRGFVFCLVNPDLCMLSTDVDKHVDCPEYLCFSLKISLIFIMFFVCCENGGGRHR